jgi:hypothetical protein
MSFLYKSRLSSRMILASLAALALVFSGVLPASALGASEIGRQELSDPIDSTGSANLSRVEVSTHALDSVNVILYFEGLVAEDAFPSSTSHAWVDIDIDGDGSADWVFWTFNDFPLRASTPIYTGEIVRSGCEAKLSANLGSSNSWVAFSIDNDCLKLPETFGVRANSDADYAPDKGFHDFTNPIGSDGLFALIQKPSPTIQGNDTPGSKLTAIPGAWDAGVTLNYKWYRQGKQVGTGSTYKTTSADRAQSITVAVTGSKASHVAATRTSEPMVMQLATLSKTPVPTIQGNNTAGSKLTALAGTWDAGVTLNYQWFRQGTQVGTGSTYKTTTKDKGKKISVKVTSTKNGYASVVKISATKTISK